MAAVVVIALGLAAFKNPTIWWASALFTVEIGLLGVTSLVAILGQGYARAACLGFALFGILYLHLTSPAYGTRYLFPPLFFELVLVRFFPSGAFEAHMQDLVENVFPGHVAYSIGTLLFACLGAIAGALIAGRGREDRNG